MINPKTSFLTTAVPLQELLNIKTFAFDIPEYQRPYQWDAVQTTQLLRDLHYGYLEHQRQQGARAQPVLLGNLVLLHQNPAQFKEAEQTQHRQWWLPGSSNQQNNSLHFCDVIDGQQRLTTLYILYAALQHLLLESGDDKNKELAQKLHGRFNSQRLVLKTSAEKFDSWFRMDTKGKHSGLHPLLKDKTVNSNSGQEKANAKIILTWLQSMFRLQQSALPGSQAGPINAAHELVSFLEYIDRHVVLTLTVTAEMDIAFRTFASLNYSGKPLTNVDILKALIVQNIERKQSSVVATILKDWNRVAADLENCQDMLDEYSENTQAWKISRGLQPLVVKRGSLTIEASLFDELLLHMRRIADATGNGKRNAEMLDYFTRHYPVEGQQGFNTDENVAHAFVTELKEYCQAFIAMFGAGQGKYLTPHTTDRASDQWASGVVFNLMCLSEQEWRPAALLGIHMARASNPHYATQALRVFMRELECITVYMEASNFKAVNVTAVINKLLNSMLSSSLAEGDSFSAKQVNKWFEGLWTGNDMLPNSKVQCLHQIDMIDLYRENKRELGYVVLLAIEHQMKVGDLKNRVQHTWDGRISIEHILPQNPDVASDWFIPPPFGPGWARESVSQWLNKLGNLCLVTLPQNSANSNFSFGVKKECMFDKTETTGTQKGSIALSLASHGDSWNPVAVQKQHIKHLNLLAERWGVEDWTGRAPPEKRAKPKPGKGNFALEPIGISNMDTESISLQASTCYTFGNEPQDNMNYVVIASPNIVDAIHAKLTVGKGRQQVKVEDCGCAFGTGIGQHFLEGSLYRPRKLKGNKRTANLRRGQCIVFGDDNHHAAYRLIWENAPDQDDACQGDAASPMMDDGESQEHEAGKFPKRVREDGISDLASMAGGDGKANKRAKGAEALAAGFTALLKNCFEPVMPALENLHKLQQKGKMGEDPCVGTTIEFMQQSMRPIGDHIGSLSLSGLSSLTLWSFVSTFTESVMNGTQLQVLYEAYSKS